ncbi:hypothetical protein PGTUg99_021531 [Puccinia graminis f. sp. tritici]|uniref:Uncharacterized protein n=1 Tax=Puccinia graminis f. sp. tritici TaxID=56615 RepID=A0A5B0NFQ5_PUCGR|nr:hypothetical protein PGTUg99_021531 [Puccinia graminis f. sp. tritici]
MNMRKFDTLEREAADIPNGLDSESELPWPDTLLSPRKISAHFLRIGIRTDQDEPINSCKVAIHRSKRPQHFKQGTDRPVNVNMSSKTYPSQPITRQLSP